MLEQVVQSPDSKGQATTRTGAPPPVPSTSNGEWNGYSMDDNNLPNANVHVHSFSISFLLPLLPHLSYKMIY